jgi:lysophospholipase L1-like esterase
VKDDLRQVKRVAVLGDSLGAGTFSFNMKSADHPDRNKFWNWLLDLISVDKNSFVTGTKVYSHLRRLEDDYPEYRWEHENFSIVGAGVHDSYFYALPKALEYNPDYIVVELFANDVCSMKPGGMTTASSYSNGIKGIVNRLVSQNPEISIVLVAPFNVAALPEVVGNKRSPWFFMKYKTLWKKMKLCPTFTSGKWRQEVEDRLRAYNDVLRPVARAYPDNVCLTWRTEMMTMERRDLSWVDSFHVSRRGAEKLSQRTYWQQGNCAD